MGADIRTDSHHAVVRGVPRLSGAPVRASRHPCRRRPWWWPGWPPRARPSSTPPTTSTAATRTSWASWRRSAPTSSASTICVASSARFGWLLLASLGNASRSAAADSAPARGVASSRARPRPARLGAWPRAGARPAGRWARAPSASRPNHPGGRRALGDLQRGQDLVGVVALDLEAAGRVRGELEGRLDAGGGLLLQVVAVDVVRPGPCRTAGGARPSGRARRRRSDRAGPGRRR